MHLIVPFAAPATEAADAAFAALAALPSPGLPHLRRLLARAGPAQRTSGDDHSLSPPHETAFAQALGLTGGDGAWPLAAVQAAATGIATGRADWALLTPVHIAVDRHQALLHDPAALGLSEADARTLFDAVAALFGGDGPRLHWGGPLQWYAEHEAFDGLRAASLDRAIARDVTPWLSAAPQPKLLRRLFSEAQMLLYGHPVNAAREAAGQLPVNALWCSGAGRAADLPRVARPVVDDRLRRPALHQQWGEWAAAWQALDAERLAPLHAHTPGRLTLCGERGRAEWPLDGGWWRRLSAPLRRPDPRRELSGL